MLFVIVEWNVKELHNVNKKLGEMTKVFKSFGNPKKGGHKNFLKTSPVNL